MTGYKYVLKQKKENEDTCYNIPCFSFNPMLNKLRLAKSCLLHMCNTALFIKYHLVTK